MEEELMNAYSEVDQILDILGDVYKQKLPTKLRELFSQKKNVNHRITISKDTKMEDLKIKRTTAIIISILNLKYWATNPDTIRFLKRQYYNNEKEYQEKINQYKEFSWLDNNKSKTNLNIQENSEETSLVELKNESIIAKVKKIIAKILFGRK